jgi:hypothetical protein
MSAGDVRHEVEVTHETSIDERPREELEREAERARARLMSTLDVLDRRRHDLLDVRARVKDHELAIVGGAAAVALLVCGAIGAAIHDAVQRRRHPSRKNRERIKALAGLWKHPDRAVRAQERSFGGEALRKVAMAVLSTVATQLASRLVKRALAETERASTAT